MITIVYRDCIGYVSVTLTVYPTIDIVAGKNAVFTDDNGMDYMIPLSDVIRIGKQD